MFKLRFVIVSHKIFVLLWKYPLYVFPCPKVTIEIIIFRHRSHKETSQQRPFLSVLAFKIRWGKVSLFLYFYGRNLELFRRHAFGMVAKIQIELDWPQHNGSCPVGTHLIPRVSCKMYGNPSPTHNLLINQIMISLNVSVCEFFL
jgi:hypothetical protein